MKQLPILGEEVMEEKGHEDPAEIRPYAKPQSTSKGHKFLCPSRHIWFNLNQTYYSVILESIHYVVRLLSMETE
jgi:hypothetical protein